MMKNYYTTILDKFKGKILDQSNLKLKYKKYTKEPCLTNRIIYGYPGSGKTRALSDIYTQLLSNGERTSNIACVAFNVSVRDELVKRIAYKTGESVEDLQNNWVSTFYGLCRRLLSTEYDIKVLPPKQAAKAFLEFLKDTYHKNVIKTDH